jgi:hypothetical protein
MGLRFVFLLTTRAASWLRLSRREEAWKAAEILVLGHQLAVLRRPATTPPETDLGGAGLLGVIPKHGANGATADCPGHDPRSAEHLPRWRWFR